jgi:hypothetical protein
MAAGPSTSDVLNFANINFLASDALLRRSSKFGTLRLLMRIVLMLLVRSVRENGEIGGIA